VQAVVLLVTVGLVLVGAAAVAARRLGVARLRSGRVQASLGVIPGLLGALYVLVRRIDLLSDPLERGLWGLLLLVAVAITIIGLARSRTGPLARLTRRARLRSRRPR